MVRVAMYDTIVQSLSWGLDVSAFGIVVARPLEDGGFEVDVHDAHTDAIVESYGVGSPEAAASLFIQTLVRLDLAQDTVRDAVAASGVVALSSVRLMTDQEMLAILMGYQV